MTIDHDRNYGEYVCLQHEMRLCKDLSIPVSGSDRIAELVKPAGES